MKILKLLGALAMAIALVAIAPFGASAQGGIQWSSTIQVQNLGTSPATYSLVFYDKTGNVATTINSSAPLAVGASFTYLTLTGLTAGFNGSAVISSSEPVAAITNLTGGSGQYYDSATGVSTTATSLQVPLLMRGNGGFNTWVSVQNAGTANTTVTISYKPGSAGTATTETATIAPGASATFDQQTNAALGAKFVGSATITADQPLAATIGQVGTGGTKSLLLYNAFGGGSTTALAPLAMANNAGYATGLSIQNVGSANATVTIKYSANSVAPLSFTPPDDVQTLAPGASYATINGTKPTWGTNRYVGSATVTSDQPIVMVVNQLLGGANSKGSAYAGFNPSSLSTKVSLPLLMVNNGGFSTGVQCANAGSAQTKITFTYSANVAGSATPPAVTVTVDPGKSATVFTGNDATPKYVGGATVTSDGQPIACIVNQLNPKGAGDTFLSYGGINY